MNPLIQNTHFPCQKLNPVSRWQNSILRDLESLYESNLDMPVDSRIPVIFVNFFVRITTFHQVNIKSKHRAIYFTHKKLQIPQKNGNYQYGKQDLFAAVIALRYLISSEDFKAFKSNLTKLINKVLRQCPHLTHEQLLMEMGFPENWEKIMRYKK